MCPALKHVGVARGEVGQNLTVINSVPVEGVILELKSPTVYQSQESGSLEDLDH